MPEVMSSLISDTPVWISHVQFVVEALEMSDRSAGGEAYAEHSGLEFVLSAGGMLINDGNVIKTLTFTGFSQEWRRASLAEFPS